MAERSDFMNNMDELYSDGGCYDSKKEIIKTADNY